MPVAFINGARDQESDEARDKKLPRFGNLVESNGFCSDVLSDDNKVLHLFIAYGSLAELETHIQVAGRLNYVYEDQINTMLEITSEIGRMLNGLRKSIEKRI